MLKSRNFLPIRLIALILFASQTHAYAASDQGDAYMSPANGDICEILRSKRNESQSRIETFKSYLSANNEINTQIKETLKKKKRAYWLGLPLSTVALAIMFYGEIRPDLLSQEDFEYIKGIKSLVEKESKDVASYKEDTKFADIIEKIFILDTSKIVGYTVWLRVDSAQIAKLSNTLADSKKSIDLIISEYAEKTASLDVLIRDNCPELTAVR